MKLSFNDRCERIITSSHVVYSDDFSIYVVDGIQTFQDEVYVVCKDGAMFRDLDVFTLQEASKMEAEMVNLCKNHNIIYNDWIRLLLHKHDTKGSA